METTSGDLSQRALAVLRAAANGRAEITCSCEPDLFIDGLACCDQTTARLLAHLGLIAPSRPGEIGSRVPVRLTDAGHRMLDALPFEAA